MFGAEASEVMEVVASDPERSTTVVFRRASESEKLGAIAELTRRQAQHSGTSAATIAALLIAAGVGLVGAYATALGLQAQSVAMQRSSAVELADLADERGQSELALEARELAVESLDLSFGLAEAMPFALLTLVFLTIVAIWWAADRARRSSVAEVWLAAQSRPAPAQPRKAVVLDESEMSSENFACSAAFHAARRRQRAADTLKG